MTTEAVSMAVCAQPEQGADFNLAEFVKDATWKELLFDLVSTNKLDPWDVDLSKVVEGYVGAVKRMKVLDLHIPANIVYAAAVLLGMKSDSLKILEPEAAELMPDGAVALGRVTPQVQPLTQRIRLQPGKRITLIELMSALDEAIKIKQERELMAQAPSAPVNFSISREDINEKLESVYNSVQSSADKTGMTTFTDLSAGFEGAAAMLTNLFIPLLFLAHKGRIIMLQERFFDEIFVKLGSGVENAGNTG